MKRLVTLLLSAAICTLVTGAPAKAEGVQEEIDRLCPESKYEDSQWDNAYYACSKAYYERKKAEYEALKAIVSPDDTAEKIQNKIEGAATSAVGNRVETAFGLTPAGPEPENPKLKTTDAASKEALSKLQNPMARKAATLSTGSVIKAGDSSLSVLDDAIAAAGSEDKTGWSGSSNSATFARVGSESSQYDPISDARHRQQANLAKQHPATPPRLVYAPSPPPPPSSVGSAPTFSMPQVYSPYIPAPALSSRRPSASSAMGSEQGQGMVPRPGEKEPQAALEPTRPRQQAQADPRPTPATTLPKPPLTLTMPTLRLPTVSIGTPSVSSGSVPNDKCGEGPYGACE